MHPKYREQHKHHSRKIRAEEAKRSKSMPARIDRIVARDLQAERIPIAWDNFLDETRRLKGRKIG